WFRPVLTDMRDSLKATFSPSLGDSKKEIPVLLKLTRNRNNRQQKIMVVGDADLLINDFTYELSAFDRMRQILKWFTDSAYPVKAPHPFPDDNRITADKDGLFYMKWFFIALIPAILFVACTIVLIRRKRK
ncbi:MAG: hypothetical protein J7497_14710, partial [Chitinophagaceae bacterium]|nr:hypothetical protein [Chitinophagaceae bacterium]